eukprot:COSAG04_NODE_619_length_11882_cov_18.845880_8_plen_81_part_00
MPGRVHRFLRRPKPTTKLILDSAPAAAAVLDALPAAPAGYDSDGSERGGDDDLNDASEVPAAIDAELMGWDTCDDGYVGS